MAAAPAVILFAVPVWSYRFQRLLICIGIDEFPMVRSNYAAWRPGNAVRMAELGVSEGGQVFILTSHRLGHSIADPERPTVSVV